MSNVNGSRPQNAHLVGGYQPGSPPAPASSPSSSVAQGPTPARRGDLVREAKHQEGDTKSLESLSPQVVSVEKGHSTAVKEISKAMDAPFGAMEWAIRTGKSAHKDPQILSALDGSARRMLSKLMKAGHDPQHILEA